jgi:RND family efflux transporter MFP subunit
MLHWVNCNPKTLTTSKVALLTTAKASSMTKVGAMLPGKSLSTVLLLAFLVGACSRGGAPPGAAKPPGVPVKLQRVETSTIEDSEDYFGKLEADRRVVLQPVVEGRVSQIFVSSGSRVAAGTPIVQIDPDKSQAEVSGAIANVNASRAALDNAQAQISSLEAERASAVADLELQNQQFTRISTLVSQGALAQQQLDQVTRDREKARADLNAIEKRIQAARASVDQANSTLKQAQANVTLRSEELKDTRVVAPIAGMVGDVTVKLGDSVNKDTSLTTITQNQTLNLQLRIPTARSSQLRVGTPVQLKSETGDEILATGRISFVSPQANSALILAKASFANPEGILRDGQPVKARVIWNRTPGVLVPTTAVSRLGGEAFVFVAQKPEKPQQGQPQQGQAQQKPPQLVAHQKPIKLGSIQGNNYQVIEGLKPGETIVVSGILNLTDNAPIIPETPTIGTGATPNKAE